MTRGKARQEGKRTIQVLKDIVSHFNEVQLSTSSISFLAPNRRAQLPGKIYLKAIFLLKIVSSQHPRRPRQKDHEFEASMGYLARP
jgi:hypothetical protein